MVELELRKYCEEHRDDIFVREKVGGRWKSIPFSQCTKDRQEYYIQRWIANQFTPHRVLRKGVQ